jgi:formylglycine-generating enzyme
LRTVLVVAGLTVTGVVCGHECPVDMVLAKPGVCIDKYEWIGFNMTRPAKPYLAFSGRPEPDGNPLVWDAEGSCQMQKKRVCTLTEWVAACRGPGGSKYPYGDKYDPTACNTDKLSMKFNEGRIWRRDEEELGRLDQSEPVGSFARCVSAVGAYDMVGNAEEWVRCANGKFGWCLAGGFWSHPQSCNEAIVVHSPYWHWFSTSFRCCKDMENT